VRTEIEKAALTKKRRRKDLGAPLYLKYNS